MSPASILPEQFATFGELLKFLRRKAHITQRELAIAVGYSDTQISRIEHNQRVPDSKTIQALFVPALFIEQEPTWVERLVELARIASEGGELGTEGKQTALNNLPNPLTSFIGRTKEIKEICKLVKIHRLITLTGPGGVGKTRLSLQVAAKLLTSFPNGVWLVEFASISDPDLVPFTLAKIFGMRESGNSRSSLIESLVDSFRTQKVLLVFDNCEHLIEPIASLAEVLLRSCQDLSILASSREVLGVAGEVAYPVPSLELPDLKSQPLIEALGEYDSVKLFIERSSTAFPSFDLTNDNAPFLAKISHHLDGIPLAIELAAAKVRVLGLEQISERLKDRFQLLTGGNRTALERHQTLRATIDWSYNLLTEPEQVLLRRLSVFVGGWTLGAAESVCGFGGIETSDILDLLTHLLDKSLVTVNTHADEARYHMLETIRQYSFEKLLDSEETDMIRQRHGEWFLSAAERVNQKFLRGQNDSHLFNQFRIGIENFRAALDWFSASQQYEKYARLAVSLEVVWFDLNHFREGRRHLESGLKHHEKLSGFLIARTKRILGRILARLGDYELAIINGEEAVNLVRSSTEIGELALSLYHLADILLEHGDDQAADAYHHQSLLLYQELGNRIFISDLMITIGWGHVRAGNFSEGFRSLDDGIKVKRELGEAYDMAYSMFVLGTCRWHSKEYGKSETAIKESIRLFLSLGDKWFAGGSLHVLAGIASGRHLAEQAAKYIGVTDKILALIHGVIPPFWVRDVYNPIVASVHDQLDDVEYANAYNQGYSMTLEQALEFAMEIANE